VIAEPQTQQSASLIPNLADITLAINALFNTLKIPGTTVELRAFNTPQGTWSGYFDNFEKLAQEAFKLSSDESVPNTYVTLQHISPELISQYRVSEGVPNVIPNAVFPKQPVTTKDPQVLSYNWLLIDFDPKRPAGISSTDAEKAEAYAVCLAAREYLFQYGVPTILADSGNGFHLLPSIDLPHTEEYKTLVKVLLYGLNALFATPTVDVDRTTYNPSRVCKLYGTVARKGANTLERPWRLSKILDVPEGLSTVPEETLRVLLASLPVSQPASKTASAKSKSEPSQPTNSSHTVGHIVGKRSQPAYVTPEMLEAEIARRKLTRIGEAVVGSPDKGNSWMKWRVECPFNPDHTKTDAYVCLCVEGPQLGAYQFHCSHNSCIDNNLEQLREKVGGFSFARPHLSELGNAVRFARNFSDTVRYVAEKKAWFVWNGSVWEEDDGSFIFRGVKALADEIRLEGKRMPCGEVSKVSGP